MPLSLKDAVDAGVLRAAAVPFPDRGALRVHPHPDRVHRPVPAPAGVPQRRGPNRFDDPHHHYPVRYLAEQLFVCLLEVLARFRANDAADAVLEQMTPGLDHPLLADLVDPEQVAGIDAFLTANQVAVFTAPSSAPPESLVDVFDPDLLAALDEHHRVREQLRRPEVVEAYGQNGTVHLEGSLIRNASTKVGRPVTQEIGWLLLDVMHVQGLRYYSRHAEGEEAICWAMNGDAPLRIGPVRALDPGDEEHRTAVQRVAARYRLSLPQHWAPGPSATFSSAYEAAVQ